MNGMPYMDMNMSMNPNGIQGNFNQNYYNSLERMNNRINRLEKQVRILENRVNRLSNNNPIFLKNEYDDNDNMYML